METKKASPLTCKEKDQKMYHHLRENFFSDSGKVAHKKKIQKLFIISLVVTIIIAMLNFGVISDWGKVSITRRTLIDYNGNKLSTLFYVPDNATDDNPAPAIVMYHGNAGNARNHESWAVEFARRGFVVAVCDQSGSGNSENETYKFGTQDRTVESILNGYVLFEAVQNCSFVDKDNMICAGHSAGGAISLAVAAKYDAKAIMLASNLPSGLKGDVEEMAAANELLKGWVGNLMVAYGDAEGNGNLEKLAKEANDWIQTKIAAGHAAYEGQTYTELNQIIGSFETGDAIMMTTDHNRVHEGAFVNSECIGKLLDFGQKSVDNVPNYMDSSEQIWYLKDYLGLAGMVSFCVLICSFALLLIEVIPFFNDVRRAPTANIGLRGKGLVISVILAIVFPFVVFKTGGMGLLNVFFESMGPPTKTEGAWPFKMTYANYSLTVIVGVCLLGALGIGLFLLDKKKESTVVSMKDFGLTASDSDKFSWNLVGKTFLLTIIIIAVAYGGLQLQEDLTGTSFYAWFFGFKALPIHRIQYYIPYIGVWILCFVIQCIGINIERCLPSTGKENLDTFLQIVFNVACVTFTIVLIIVINWILDSNASTDFAFFNTYKIEVEKIWGMPAGMTVCAIGSTLLYRNTRNTWLSAFLMGTICALLCVTFGHYRVLY